VRVALYSLPEGALAPVFDRIWRGPIYEQIAEALCEDDRQRGVKARAVPDVAMASMRPAQSRSAACVEGVRRRVETGRQCAATGGCAAGGCAGRAAGLGAGAGRSGGSEFL
jgi:hypothetical protein